MKKLTLTLIFSVFAIGLFAQEKKTQKAVSHSKAIYMREIPSIAVLKSTKRFIPTEDKNIKEVNPKNWGANMVVPGKGLPLEGQGDPLANKSIRKKHSKIKIKEPILSFEAATSNSTPSDPTGAVGPNHYINSWNSSFTIYDKEGNRLTPPASLSTIWPRESLGDPIVFYDNFAQRFVITQFSNSPDGFLIAVCKGDDPVNDGWYTYRFNTGSFPDYPKFSVWSDGYYITANKDQGSPRTSEVVFALERDKLIAGDQDAQIAGFSLPGIRLGGFYSPAGFNAIGSELPPVGNAPIIYMQDDAWRGVSEDALKIWNINVDWDNIGNSTIEESQELTVSNNDISSFDGVFNGGGFNNLAQPNGVRIDALQATIMYMTNYRRFSDHNSAVLNFVVDLEGNDQKAGIRWYELRQSEDGQPWTVYQEGTYVQPNGDSAFGGAMCMDKFGNIALAYTIVSRNTPVSLRYTGRLASDEKGEMTMEEKVIVDGTGSTSFDRYGDYSQTTIDPIDDTTFWYIGEYFTENTRKNRVGAFRFMSEQPNDVGVTSVLSPISGELTNAEQIRVIVKNFGTENQSNFPIELKVDGNVIGTGTIDNLNAEEEIEFTFSEVVDMSEQGRTYKIEVTTLLSNDSFPSNNTILVEVTHLANNDVGVVSIDSPSNGDDIDQETVIVTLENFGADSQSNFDISYKLGNLPAITQQFTNTVNPGQTATFSFTNPVNVSSNGLYTICANTALQDDADTSNDEFCKSFANLDCIPVSTGSQNTGGCEQDGVRYFELGTIANESGCGTDNGAVGYSDFTNLSTDLDRSNTEGYKVVLKSGFDGEVASLWIDFNDNAVFEESEQLLSNVTLPTKDINHSFDIVIPSDANLGNHLMRVKAIDPSGTGTDIDTPCGDVQWGETEDYIVNIVDGNDLNVDDLKLNNAVLNVSSEDMEHYQISLQTDYSEPLRIAVHNMLGQKVVENKIYHVDGKYTYDLDMSYAATGFYLIRIGSSNFGKVKKIVVK